MGAVTIDVVKRNFHTMAVRTTKALEKNRIFLSLSLAFVFGDVELLFFTVSGFISNRRLWQRFIGNRVEVKNAST